MASVMAIVSKAVFEKMAPKGVTTGTLIATDRYVSGHKAFESLGRGDAIFMVTVRPPAEKLWLVAILEGPAAKGGAYIGAANATKIVDATGAIKKLVLANGQGVTAKKGALGMSLQTPRVLADADVTLLRGIAGSTTKAAKPTKAAAKPAKAVAKKPAKPAKAAASSTGRSRAGEAYANAVADTPLMKKAARTAAKLAKSATGAGLRLDNYRRPFEAIAKVTPAEQKQLLSLIAQEGMGTLEEAAGNEEWLPMELVDVIDDATNSVRYQFYLWPYGSGALFEHGTTKNPANVCQHHWDQHPDDPTLRKAMAVAWHNAKKLNIQEMVNFGDA